LNFSRGKLIADKKLVDDRLDLLRVQIDVTSPQTPIRPVMMLASIRPELFGAIIIAGSPLSYWAGVRGKNPMR
jgi:Protein of unknown function (DUF3141)